MVISLLHGVCFSWRLQCCVVIFMCLHCRQSKHFTCCPSQNWEGPTCQLVPFPETITKRSFIISCIGRSMNMRSCWEIGKWGANGMSAGFNMPNRWLNIALYTPMSWQPCKIYHVYKLKDGSSRLDRDITGSKKPLIVSWALKSCYIMLKYGRYER